MFMYDGKLCRITCSYFLVLGVWHRMQIYYWLISKQNISSFHFTRGIAIIEINLIYILIKSLSTGPLPHSVFLTKFLTVPEWTLLPRLLWSSIRFKILVTHLNPIPVSFADFWTLSLEFGILLTGLQVRFLSSTSPFLNSASCEF